MCYICKLRIQKLLEKGYIFDAQVDEVTQEVKKDFDKMFEKICENMTDIEVGAAVATLIQGMGTNPQDYLKATVKTMNKMHTDYGMTDDLLDQVLQNYDPKKAN